ncbi:thioredoxin family protein [Bosea sp. PAMC 26642]|uniref:thioredoxin family protein n=1 Tax=Bosea sp. (strain PAMC 26642) TaxID=1792307 RepID=UPI0007701CF9|nr:thioredoxin family protein [Bosea sp. PAMC 26642]AMJ59594.1 thioredoxin [Bosea sp. PAMC 26642]
MSLTRRNLGLAAVALASLASASSAVAFSAKAPFDVKAFEAAQAAGESILVEISAPWCPTCKAQKPIILSLGSKPEFATLTVFEVDFDSQKDVVRMLKSTMQSTLIIYKGKQEVGRSVGDTNAASIEALLKKGV